MQDTKQQIDLISKDFDSLEKSLDTDKKRSKLLSLEAKSTDPNFWDDTQAAKKIMQEIGDIKQEIEEIGTLKEDIATLKGLISEGESSSDFEKDIKSASRRLEKLKITLLLNGPHDAKNALVSIHAGQGGTEAMDWVSMLYRMYLKYCERKNWKTQTIDVSEGEEAGIKSVSFEVEGKHAYGYLKNEAGTHRLVRQSPFNADKKRQTSFALVGILPEFEDVDLPDIEIKDEDLDWQFYRASSQGGQNVQKVSSAVRLKHKPTGMVVTAQTERYQEQNRRYALNLLRGKLWLLEKEKEKKRVKDIKGDYTPASWGTQIRSYVLHPYKMVKDLRTQVEISDPESVLDGKIDEFIESELKFASKNKL